MKQILRYISVFALTSQSSAFLSPPTTHALQSVLDPSNYDLSRKSFTSSISSNGNKHTQLMQSSNDDADQSNTINIAIFSNKSNDIFQNALTNHPFCKMTGVSLSIDWVENSKEVSWSKSELDVLQSTDIACFSTASSVKQYLKKLDNHLNVDPALPQEERRKLPNKPDLIADILGGEGSAVNELMAACPSTETARECLNSGRWMANHIYYPKDGQAVELKTEAIVEGEEDDSGEVEEDGEVDVDVWAALVMQAAGDVLERKFWGGGW